MKTSLGKFCVLILLGTWVLSACASNPADDRFTSEELELLNSTPQTELASIDQELSAIEQQLSDAKTRLSTYQAKPGKANQSLISGVQAEVSLYQGKKSHLMAKKQELNQQISAQ